MTQTILVTGGNGQLANCIKDLQSKHITFNFLFTSTEDLDITDAQKVENYFKSKKIDWCINCAAYTAVDQAEKDKENAENVNVLGANNLAQACNEFNAKLIHVSTDFVFDGRHFKAYSEEDSTNPLGVYGQTKLAGEQIVQKLLSSHFIVRTSWLYSEHGNNFMKTMLRLSNDRKELNIVADQIGTPTYAGDLAQTLIQIIISKSSDYGVYHYSNEGVASWYDFATAIFDIKDIDTKTFPIKTEAYPTPAKRPHFSVLDKTKIKTALSINIPHWRKSLKIALSKL